MAKAKVTTKTKKKLWLPVVAPKIFANKKLGDTYALEPKQAIGRTISYNLRELTESMKDQNVYLTFRVKNWSNDTLTTEIIGYEITPASIKRMIRRNTSRIDGITIVSTSDSKQVRFKFIAQTRHSCQRSVRTQLLKASMERLAAEVGKLNYGNLIDKLVSHKLQAETKKALTLLYPMKNFEVKSMELVTERKKGEEEEVAEEPEQEPKAEAKEEEQKEENLEAEPLETKPEEASS